MDKLSLRGLNVSQMFRTYFCSIKCKEKVSDSPFQVERGRGANGRLPGREGRDSRLEEGVQQSRHPPQILQEGRARLGMLAQRPPAGVSQVIPPQFQSDLGCALHPLSIRST